jgi:flagellar L-ring protein FlgH
MPIKRSDRLAVVAVAVLIGATPAIGRRPPPGFGATVPLPLPLPVADGSIFHAGDGYAALYEGHRARSVGDPLTILLNETVSATKSAGSNNKRDGGFSILPPSAGLFSFLNPNALKASGGSSFKGQGTASQTSSLVGQVTVTIADVRANGTALVKGEKRMLLSQGQEWVQFAGIVRLADISSDNVIESSRVADAHIEYSGNGASQRAAREGWLSRFFNAVSPF